MVVHRLAALVSLVFVVSRCAIDDRELEEHDGDDDNGGSANGGSASGKGGTSSGGTSGKGGTSSGGTSSGGTSSGGASSGGASSGGTSGIDCNRDSDDSDCFACEKASCCDEYQECFASDQCLDYVYCGADCLDTACITACGIAFPDGEALFFAFTSCGDAYCAEIC